MNLNSVMNVDSSKYLVIGAGITGWSVAEHLYAQQKSFRIMDTRDIPPYAAQLKQMLPAQQICFGRFDQSWIDTADVIVVSPGVSLQTPELAQLNTSNVELIGDIELFARQARKPYIAITGSNGKSTVTTLVVDILNSQGITAKAGGNIGTPALSLLDEDDVDMYVLELSSFQLETSASIQASAATVLNVSADHLDRHHTLEQYAQIKHSIYRHAKRKVFFRDETRELEGGVSFGLDEPKTDHFGIKQDSTGRWLVQGNIKIIAAKDLPLKGATGELNVLAALALCDEHIRDEFAALNAIRNFSGLPHRCELVVEKDDVQWINDSKGTNVGATVAAITSFDRPQILIVGGIHKGGSTDMLVRAVQEKVRLVIVYGRDKEIFIEALQESTTVVVADSLMQAVQQAIQHVNRGETVLFSPACSSFDMFANYQERGHAYQQAVLSVLEEDRHVD